MARVLFISTREDSSWKTGEELWSRAAEELGANQDVACSIPSRPELNLRLRELEAKGIAVFPEEQRGTALMQMMNWVLSQRYQLKAIPPLERTLSTFRPDLAVILQAGNLDGGKAMTTCHKLGVPYCNVISAVSEVVGWPSDLVIEEQRPLYQNSRCLFLMSRRNRQFLETQFSTDFPNASFVWNTLQIAREMAVPWPTSMTPLRLACVAPIEFSTKGQDLLVDIFARTKWRDRPVMLNFYGMGPQSQILQERIRQAELSKVTWRGPVSDAESIWDDHHALILPSRQEGMPRALVEAFFCGRPAVVTRVGGNAELVDEGINGFIAPSPTIELMDQALERLWENREQLAGMGLKAWGKAEQEIPRDPAREFTSRLRKLLPVEMETSPITNEVP